MEEEASKMEKVFNDFSGRRTGIIKALTVDVKEFVRQCDLGSVEFVSEEEDEVCLYGVSDGEWRVSAAAAEKKAASWSPRPEPFSGINLARDNDRSQLEEWLVLVAALSDAWLLSSAFYNGASYSFDRAQRQHLFGMINDLPTILETITGRHKCRKPHKTRAMENNEEEDNEICGGCEKKPKPNEREFWICCDFCDTWFHGRCVNVTLQESKLLQNFKCPSCSYKDGCKKKTRQQSMHSERKVPFKLQCDKSH